MKSCSHRTLGQFLTDKYLHEYPRFCRHAFSLGCIQPDKNPTTYLKGSLRWQWMRGHNWDNAKAYIRKTGNHLQARKKLKLLDFYRLGKLIHYTADAFTYSHNKHYTDNLSAHRSYERDLHRKLEQYLAEHVHEFQICLDSNGTISDFISKNHKRYMLCLPCIDNDTDYCVRMCAQVLQLMLQSKQLSVA